jgi:hypothetical protein
MKSTIFYLIAVAALSTFSSLAWAKDCGDQARIKVAGEELTKFLKGYGVSSFQIESGANKLERYGQRVNYNSGLYTVHFSFQQPSSGQLYLGSLLVTPDTCKVYSGSVLFNPALEVQIP